MSLHVEFSMISHSYIHIVIQTNWQTCFNGNKILAQLVTFSEIGKLSLNIR